MSRWSSANAVRLLRAARNATARASIRHRRDVELAASLARCLALLNEAERELLGENRRAVRRERRAA